MKSFIIKFSMLILMLFFGATCLISAQEMLQAENAVLLEMEGTVMVWARGGNKWRKAELDDTMKAGDFLQTMDKSYCILVLSDGSTVKVGRNTKLGIQGLTGEKNEFKLSKGKIWMNVNKRINKKTDFRINAPHTIAAVRGTIFEVRADGNQDEIIVHEGRVDVSTKKGENMAEVDLKENQQILCGTPGFIGNVKNFNADDCDQWQQWNKEVDVVLAQVIGRDSAQVAILIEDGHQAAPEAPSPAYGNIQLKSSTNADSNAEASRGEPGNDKAKKPGQIEEKKEKSKADMKDKKAVNVKTLRTKIKGINTSSPF